MEARRARTAASRSGFATYDSDTRAQSSLSAPTRASPVNAIA